MLKSLALLFAGGFLFHHCYGKTHRLSPCHKDKLMRSRLDEDQIDHMVEDSFPASDPPSTY